MCTFYRKLDELKKSLKPQENYAQHTPKRLRLAQQLDIWQVARLVNKISGHQITNLTISSIVFVLYVDKPNIQFDAKTSKLLQLNQGQRLLTYIFHAQSIIGQVALKIYCYEEANVGWITRNLQEFTKYV